MGHSALNGSLSRVSDYQAADDDPRYSNNTMEHITEIVAQQEGIEIPRGRDVIVANERRSRLYSDASSTSRTSRASMLEVRGSVGSIVKTEESDTSFEDIPQKRSRMDQRTIAKVPPRVAPDIAKTENSSSDTPLAKKTPGQIKCAKVFFPILTFLEFHLCSSITVNTAGGADKLRSLRLLRVRPEPLLASLLL
ncbi:unnamed protein product [Strongylus vulgaris]|uniref:Uncharacterized protein n=1 Tax=Strongylus vulgaris TaxID=40348 RepID=A0A3P7IAR7_STRVU|nr:unnamed protein product [Strongylus vulgaris]